jgi:hypothetical protein
MPAFLFRGFRRLQQIISNWDATDWWEWMEIIEEELDRCRLFDDGVLWLEFNMGSALERIDGAWWVGERAFSRLGGDDDFWDFEEGAVGIRGRFGFNGEAAQR